MSDPPSNVWPIIWEGSRPLICILFVKRQFGAAADIELVVAAAGLFVYFFALKLLHLLCLKMCNNYIMTMLLHAEPYVDYIMQLGVGENHEMSVSFSLSMIWQSRAQYLQVFTFGKPCKVRVELAV